MARVERLIDRALAAAELSACRHALGAVVARGGRVLAVASNKTRNDPRNASGQFSVHAEVAALGMVASTADSTIYVARIGRSGTVTMARPCEACRQKIFAAGIKRVFYTYWDGQIISERVTEEWSRKNRTKISDLYGAA